MRLAELSERSGVSTATIKYYLREGLLPPGRQINATTAEYDEEHLRRLRLVRAMIQVGPGAGGDGPRGARTRGRRLPGPHDPSGRGPVGAAAGPGAGRGRRVRPGRARTRSTALLGPARLGERQASSATISPAYRSLVVAVAALRRLGYPCDAEQLAPYAGLMHRSGRPRPGLVETHASEAEQMEIAVLSAILNEPVLLSLRRLAQEEESARRYGFE